ncbi:MAG: hypothetical protein GXY83_25345 [Rhodopirellula sp.]|nr:hypothetical protein [Rhodopirellula sp.]
MKAVLMRMWAVLVVGAMAASVGCGGGGVERVDVFGAVTYQGEPVKDGSIMFVPQAEGATAGTNITDGKYAAEGDGGVPPGKYFVKISSTVEDKENWVEDAMPIPPSKELLPEKYNATTELTLEVPSGAGELEQNYDLQ